MNNLTKKEEKELEKLLMIEISQRPPTIGLVGVSGVGKSSTINTLFKTNLAISHTVACTKEFEEIEIGLKAKQGVLKGKEVQLVVIDAPGLGEDIDKDSDYLEMYKKNLPKCDVIIWILSARNRAIALDQKYLNLLEEFHGQIIFGLNQVDLIEPMNWSSNLPIPSEIQRKYLKEIIDDRKEKLEKIIKKEIVIIPYSNIKQYNLEVLFTTILESCQSKRKWLLYSLKAFDFNDFEQIKEVKTNQERSIMMNIKNKGAIFNELVKQFLKSAELTEAGKHKVQEFLDVNDIPERDLTEEEITKLKEYIKQEDLKSLKQ